MKQVRLDLYGQFPYRRKHHYFKTPTPGQNIRRLDHPSVDPSILGWKYKSHIYPKIYPLTVQYCDNLQSEHRLVPEHIPRPDYADHPQGFPLSEQKLKGNTYMRQLDADEIDGEEGEVVLLQLQ